MMFDSVEMLADNLVIPVVYRATLKLMKEYQSKPEPRGRFIGDIHASADRGLRRKSNSRQSAIDSEVRKILREIETKERKPLKSLGPAEVANYVNMLSNIATRRAAKAYVGSSISNPEAKDILVRLRESYR